MDDGWRLNPPTFHRASWRQRMVLRYWRWFHRPRSSAR